MNTIIITSIICASVVIIFWICNHYVYLSNKKRNELEDSIRRYESDDAEAVRIAKFAIRPGITVTNTELKEAISDIINTLE